MDKKTVRRHDIANRFVYSLSQPVLQAGSSFLYPDILIICFFPS